MKKTIWSTLRGSSHVELYRPSAERGRWIGQPRSTHFDVMSRIGEARKMRQLGYSPLPLHPYL